jgi:16S rRNA (uracil1498-N3)-methyltransferase
VTPAAADSLRRAAAHVLVDDVSVPVLDDDAAHHVFRVLRIRDGDVVSVTDGRGGWRLCRAGGDLIEPDSDVVAEPHPERGVSIAFAIPKQDRPEWIVQKLTELGVSRILLLHADRSVVRWTSERAAKHLAKLRRVAAEALQQSRGVWLPSVDGPTDAAGVLGEFLAAEPGAAPLSSFPIEACSAVAVGPEGGWSPDELDAAHGTVSLGARVLRVETAAVTAGVLTTARAA